MRERQGMCRKCSFPQARISIRGFLGGEPMDKATVPVCSLVGD